MTNPQHDPFGDGTGKVLQALAVLSTVGEAAARFVATGAQNKAAASERTATAERVADTARRHADQAAARARTAQLRADRQLMNKAFDPDWLASADFDETSTLWRTAAMYSMSGDPRAIEARRRAQERLRTLNPGLMDDFARHRAAGLNLAEAMKAAAHDVWRHQTRPETPPAHTAPPTPPADGAATKPTAQEGVDGLQTATQAEMNRLAEGVDLQLLDALQRQWRSTGQAPAADAAAHLADAVRHQHTDNTRTEPATTPQTPRGTRPPGDDFPPGSDDTVDRPARTGNTPNPTGAADRRDGADTAHAHEAEGQHLAGIAMQEQRAGNVDGGVPDLASTTVNEHQDAEVSSRRYQGGGDHDQAGADQQRRLSRAFPPLGTLTPTFSSPLTTTPPPGPRKGRTR